MTHVLGICTYVHWFHLKTWNRNVMPSVTILNTGVREWKTYSSNQNKVKAIYLLYRSTVRESTLLLRLRVMAVLWVVGETMCGSEARYTFCWIHRSDRVGVTKTFIWLVYTLRPNGLWERPSIYIPSPTNEYEWLNSASQDTRENKKLLSGLLKSQLRVEARRVSHVG